METEMGMRMETEMEMERHYSNRARWTEWYSSGMEKYLENLYKIYFEQKMERKQNEIKQKGVIRF